jgi:hypothetical protein
MGNSISDDDSLVLDHSFEPAGKHLPQIPYKGSQMFPDFTGRLFMRACLWIEVLSTLVKRHEHPP